MVRLLIANALGCILLTSCISNPKVQPVEISAKPIEKPVLILPVADEVFMRPVKWTILTPENFEEEIAKLEGRPVAFFSLTDEGYANLGLNISSIRALVQQQATIISAYENYYQSANKALDDANAEINETAAEAEKGKIIIDEPKKWWEFRK